MTNLICFVFFFFKCYTAFEQNTACFVCLFLCLFVFMINVKVTKGVYLDIRYCVLIFAFPVLESDQAYTCLDYKWNENYNNGVIVRILMI